MQTTTVTGTSKEAFEKLNAKGITQKQSLLLLSVFIRKENWTRGEIAHHFREKYTVDGNIEHLALSEKSTVAARVRKLVKDKYLIVLLEKRHCTVTGEPVGQLECVGNRKRKQRELF